jgi:transmembrane sensor
MENSTTIWHLIARVLNGEATPEDELELAEVLSQDQLLRQQYELLSQIWKEKYKKPDLEDNTEVRATISRIINKAESREYYAEIPVKRTSLTRQRIWWAAASVLLLAMAGGLWLSNNLWAKGTKREAIEARKGSRSRSLLPDGTTVWLNAGSKLSYDNDFAGPTREVRLEGEAFFDVVKQPEHPFIVHTSGIDIKVLGTAFNVKSYPEDKTVETTLYRGLVKVFREAESEFNYIQLRPNEKLILPKEAAIKSNELPEERKSTFVRQSSDVNLPNIKIDHIDSTKKESERYETAWMYSRLEFRGDSFEELARKLERWYNVVIVFTDEDVKQLSFNGSFEKENVEQAFRALKVANKFNYKINNHEIFVGSER